MHVTEQTQDNVSSGVLDVLSAFASAERVKLDDYAIVAKLIGASMATLAAITIAAVLVDVSESHLGALAFGLLSADLFGGR